MSAYDEELLKAATRLLARPAGRRGPIGSAYVRRRISTSYYALFHFLLEEVTRRVARTGNGLRGRVRRVIRAWRNADVKADRDFKHALSILILLRGQLRVES